MDGERAQPEPAELLDAADAVLDEDAAVGDVVRRLGLLRRPLLLPAAANGRDVQLHSLEHQLPLLGELDMGRHLTLSLNVDLNLYKD